MRQKVVASVLVLFALVSFEATAQESSFSIQAEPQIFVPLRESGSLFTLGAGGAFSVLLDPAAPYYLQGRLAYAWLPTAVNTALNMVTLTGGGGLRIDLGGFGVFRLGASLGGFLGLYEGLSGFNPSVTAETSFEVLLGTAFRVAIGAGYDYHVGTVSLSPLSESSFLEGLRATVGVSFAPAGLAAAGLRRPRIEIQPPQYQRVFPVFYQFYNESPLGTVAIRNGERQRITDVRVSFFVNQYMDAPKVSMTIPSIEPGASVEVPVLGLFNESILGVTEPTSVSSQVSVEYLVGDELLSASRSDTLRVLNRNNMTWDDDRKAAAFVTANDPTVQRFSRNITASVRSEGVLAINEQLRTAMALFEALKLHGMEYVVDPDSSFVELSRNESALDYLQFPQQTLDFRTGDCDDLSILYASMLESVGIRTAFVTVPGHIFMAFAMDMDREEAEATFRRPEDLIYVDDEAWVPVEVTLVRENFLAAWDSGAKQWREGAQSDTAALLQVRQAWATYPPTGFASDAIQIAVPQTTVVVPAYTRVLEQFIDREIGPRVTELQERIDASGGNSRLVNRLGTLYARYGRYDDAKEQFQKAIAKDNYLPALVNLGNIYYLDGDLENAFAYFDRARQVRSDDPEVLISLARVHFDLEQYLPATQRYREAEILAPEVAREFAYIVSENVDTARASAAQERRRVIWDEE